MQFFDNTVAEYSSTTATASVVRVQCSIYKSAMEYLTASYYSSLDTAVELLSCYSSSKKDILKYTRCEKKNKTSMNTTQ